MRSSRVFETVGVAAVGIAAFILVNASPTRGNVKGSVSPATFDDDILAHAQKMFVEGRDTFRYDTFGDEDFWGGQLRMHEAILGIGLGGVGSGLSPNAALGLGLKVDIAALPPNVIASLQNGALDLDDPGNTVELLRLNSVVGVTGFFGAGGTLQSFGIQCALCHSTVDDVFSPGIGNRLDGWANRDLDVGRIVSLAPTLKPFSDVLGVTEDVVKDVLLAWGPGKFDAQLMLDGKGFRRDGSTAATLIPPAFGLAGVNLHTSTGWGSVTHWNAFVANIEMHGKGNFFDPRLDNAKQFPVAARNGFGHIVNDVDLISDKLPALQFYQLAIPAPVPPAGSFDAAAAARGDLLFAGKARCAECHMGSTYTEPGWNMHRANEIGIDEFQSDRAPDRKYRTAPLAGLWTHQTGGFYHDGRFATLLDVVEHYDTFFGLGLSPLEMNDVVEYLKSLPD